MLISEKQIMKMMHLLLLAATDNLSEEGKSSIFKCLTEITRQQKDDLKEIGELKSE